MATAKIIRYGSGIDGFALLSRNSNKSGQNRTATVKLSGEGRTRAGL